MNLYKKQIWTSTLVHVELNKMNQMLGEITFRFFHSIFYFITLIKTCLFFFLSFPPFTLHYMYLHFVVFLFLLTGFVPEGRGPLSDGRLWDGPRLLSPWQQIKTGAPRIPSGHPESTRSNWQLDRKYGNNCLLMLCQWYEF